MTSKSRVISVRARKCGGETIVVMEPWVEGNEVIVKNVKASHGVNISVFFVVVSSAFFVNRKTACKRGKPRFCRETELGHCRLESMN